MDLQRRVRQIALRESMKERAEMAVSDEAYGQGHEIRFVLVAKHAEVAAQAVVGIKAGGCRRKWSVLVDLMPMSGASWNCSDHAPPRQCDPTANHLQHPDTKLNQHSLWNMSKE